MESIAQLREICQAQKKQKKFLLSFGYTFHRNISIKITWLILRFFPSVRPNQISVIMIFIGCAGSLLLIFRNENLWNLVGVTIVYLSFLLDKVDGEIARYKNIFTLRGIFLDELYHILVPPALLLGILYPLLHKDTHTLMVVLVVVLSVLSRYLRKISAIALIKTETLIRHGSTVARGKLNTTAEKILKLLPIRIGSIIERFDIIILMSFLLIVLNELYLVDYRPYFLYIYFILILMHFLRWLMMYYWGYIDQSVERYRREGY